MSDETLGAKLLVLKDRSGLSLENIAKAAGYSRASSIQRYFSADYDAKYLARNVADKLKEAMVGYGDPAIAASDIERLTEFGFTYDRKLPRPLSPEMFRRGRREYIDCNPTFPDDSFQWEVELFRVADDPLLTFKRPEHLIRRPIAAIFVSTMAMAPRYRTGDIVVIESERPAMIGQDVFVGIMSEERGQFGFLATLVNRTRDKIVVSTLNPAAEIELPLGDIDECSPILTLTELLTPAPTHDA